MKYVIVLFRIMNHVQSKCELQHLKNACWYQRDHNLINSYHTGCLTKIDEFDFSLHFDGYGK